MSKEKVRITKLPEERKQEIMDVAMGVFAEKGYDQTTMRDIADAVGVVPGLCYRYFSSKQELFQNAVQQYIIDSCTPMIEAMQANQQDLDNLLNTTVSLFTERDGREKYHNFFHKTENHEFNILLSSGICDYMQPFVKELFDQLNAANLTSIADTTSFSQFILYGQIPIINDSHVTSKEKAEKIKEYIMKLCN